MSRISALMPQLQLVQPISEPGEPRSNWEDTTWNGSRGQGSSSSVQESRRTLQCSKRSGVVIFGPSASLSSPFASIAVH